MFWQNFEKSGLVGTLNVRQIEKSPSLANINSRNFLEKKMSSHDYLQKFPFVSK